MARRRGVLPKGAGGVRCTICGAHAAADGRGSPIILRHKPDCPESCGWCAHPADVHTYGAGDALNVPCTACPDGKCHRQTDETKEK